MKKLVFCALMLFFISCGSKEKDCPLKNEDNQCKRCAGVVACPS